LKPSKLPDSIVAAATVPVTTVASIWRWLSARNTSAWLWKVRKEPPAAHSLKSSSSAIAS
jgi:hypothetical protein